MHLVLLTLLARAETREVGALTLDGVPEIAPEVSQRTRQYAEVRGASFLDFDPSGAGMLISTRFGDTAQVHRVRAPGGDRRQLTFFPDAVGGAFWDPGREDGFYFTMDQKGGEFYQIYWFDLASGRARLLTDGTSRNQSLAVSPKGGRLAYASTRRNKTDFDLYVQGREDAEGRRVAELSGDWSPLAWSPDERSVLLVHEVSVNESALWLADVATGALTRIDATPERVAYGSATFTADGASVVFTSDQGAEVKRIVRYELASGQKRVLVEDPRWDVQSLALSEDGKWMAWELNEGGRSSVWLAPLDRPGRARLIELPVGVVSGMRFDRESRRLALTLSTADSPADVWTVDLAGRATRWTYSELGGLDPATFVTPSLIEYPSFDGKMIPAWLHRPRGNAKVPVVINIHGGPEGQSSAGFNSGTQYWVNELGVAVISPNVRGSTGYGKTWVTLDDGLRRMDSVRDVGALLDWIATQPDLDADRVAVVGASYGGFMVLASMVEYGDRLRCGVDMVGISDFVTFLEKTEAYRRDLRRVEYGDEREPEMRAFLTSIAPARHADRIVRPLLVGQGSNDPRVPQAEAEQIVRAVRDSGGTAWYVLAADEGHGFRKKANRQVWSDVVSAFFEQNLLPVRAP
jgi:dipeptidyl aminopeptidase/acylaminoacyl peptidase